MPIDQRMIGNKQRQHRCCNQRLKHFTVPARMILLFILSCGLSAFQQPDEIVPDCGKCRVGTVKPKGQQTADHSLGCPVKRFPEAAFVLCRSNLLNMRMRNDRFIRRTIVRVFTVISEQIPINDIPGNRIGIHRKQFFCAGNSVIVPQKHGSLL